MMFICWFKGKNAFSHWGLKCTSLCLLLVVSLCCEQPKTLSQAPKKVETTEKIPIIEEKIATGAEQVGEYLPLLKGKKVALIVNHSSMIGQKHLADSLQLLGIQIVKIFAPEHGFRGTADAGANIKDGKDAQTGIPLLSLYGKRKKPTAEDLADVDILVFDIQDVGARFYTYISTLFYVLEACSEQNKPILVLDRPNPNGHYVDGPVLKKGFESFVGIAPIPIVHGCTVGELAQMFVHEGWIGKNKDFGLSIQKCKNYDHNSRYVLPVKPSPNLPNQRAIYLYPSLCLFEGTVVSVGRGTDYPFQVFGHPDYPTGLYSFTPKPNPGNAQPLLEGKICNGVQLFKIDEKILSEEKRINLGYLLDFYRNYPKKADFFLKNNFFDKLAGNTTLREQVVAGKGESEIRSSWQEDLEKYRAIRKQYLLYTDYK